MVSFAVLSLEDERANKANKTTDGPAPYLRQARVEQMLVDQLEERVVVVRNVRARNNRLLGQRRAHKVLARGRASFAARDLREELACSRAKH